MFLKKHIFFLFYFIFPFTSCLKCYIGNQNDFETCKENEICYFSTKLNLAGCTSSFFEIGCLESKTTCWCDSDLCNLMPGTQQNSNEASQTLTSSSPLLTKTDFSSFKEMDEVEVIQPITIKIKEISGVKSTQTTTESFRKSTQRAQENKNEAFSLSSEINNEPTYQPNLNKTTTRNISTFKKKKNFLYKLINFDIPNFPTALDIKNKKDKSNFTLETKTTKSQKENFKNLIEAKKRINKQMPRSVFFKNHPKLRSDTIKLLLNSYVGNESFNSFQPLIKIFTNSFRKFNWNHNKKRVESMTQGSNGKSGKGLSRSGSKKGGNKGTNGGKKDKSGKGKANKSNLSRRQIRKERKNRNRRLRDKFKDINGWTGKKKWTRKRK